MAYPGHLQQDDVVHLILTPFRCDRNLCRFNICKPPTVCKPQRNLTDQLTVTPERIGRIEASISFWFLPISVQFYARLNRTESVREVDATWIRMYIGRGSSERQWRYHAGRGGGAVSQIVDRPPNLAAVLFTHCGQLILRKKTSKFDAARCQILRLNASNSI